MSPWWSRPTAESESPDDAEPSRPGETAGEKKAAPTKARKTEKPETSARPPRAADKGEKAEKSDQAETPEKKPEKKADKPASRSRRSGSSKPGPKKASAKKAAATVTHDITPADLASIHRELSEGPSVPEAVPERTQPVSDERKIALFCDLENIALGVRDSDIKKFDINLVLERLLEKGKVIVKRAYCDWERYSEYKRAFHEAAIEMLDIPQKYYSGKNSADIKMVVDAMDLCYSNEHLDTFVLLSGDSDFSPLVSKLREADKYVIGMGVKNSSSALLVDNCDEFIYYEDLWRDHQSAPEVTGTTANKKTSEAFRLMIDAIQALLRENKDVLWGSMVKQTMQRKKPSFNEGYYGYGSFSELLEEAERQNILKLKKDQRSGSYVVTGFAKKA